MGGAEGGRARDCRAPSFSRHPLAIPAGLPGGWARGRLGRPPAQAAAGGGGRGRQAAPADAQPPLLDARRAHPPPFLVAAQALLSHPQPHTKHTAMPGERFSVRLLDEDSGSSERVQVGWWVLHAPRASSLPPRPHTHPLPSPSPLPQVEVGLEGFNVLDPGGGRALRKYPLHHISRWSMRGTSLILYTRSPVREAGSRGGCARGRGVWEGAPRARPSSPLPPPARTMWRTALWPSRAMSRPSARCWTPSPARACSECALCVGVRCGGAGGAATGRQRAQASKRAGGLPIAGRVANRCGRSPPRAAPAPPTPTHTPCPPTTSHYQSPPHQPGWPSCSSLGRRAGTAPPPTRCTSCSRRARSRRCARGCVDVRVGVGAWV